MWKARVGSVHFALGAAASTRFLVVECHAVVLDHFGGVGIREHLDVVGVTGGLLMST
jgi:hypothetical protein